MKKRAIGLCAILLLSLAISRSQYSVEAGPLPPHPIDKKYEGKLEFLDSNYEMEQAIIAAEADWRALMKEKLVLLLVNLSVERQTQLRASQDAWEAAFEKDRKFFFGDHEQLRSSVGREGEILSKLEFMLRVRTRALDLTEYAKIFVVIPDGGLDKKSKSKR